MPLELGVWRIDAGAGLVQAMVNGPGELAEIRIDPKALDDIEIAKASMAELTGGFDISGLEQLLGG